MEYRDLAGRTSKQLASRAMQKAMRGLGIRPKSMPPIDDQMVEFWYRSCRKAGPLTWKAPTRRKS
jgi:hypothetical protein